MQEDNEFPFHSILYWEGKSNSFHGFTTPGWFYKSNLLSKDDLMLTQLLFNLEFIQISISHIITITSHLLRSPGGSSLSLDGQRCSATTRTVAGKGLGALPSKRPRSRRPLGWNPTESFLKTILI